MTQDAAPATNSVQPKHSYDADEIARILPHRWPMLMLDSATDMVPGVSATGIKNVSNGESWCPGHFPGKVVFPGVLAVEALAQLALLVCAVDALYKGRPTRSIGYLTGLRNFRFRRLVVPGDRLVMKIERTAGANGTGEFRGEARVDGVLAVTGVLTAADAHYAHHIQSMTAEGASR
ncbi:3-hydroxyacyl-ACP dehydratase FabZ [Nonomuraea sp. K274]|uniref:3-hydroxyacyl-ACP dehydratase FabZ n=1 Tax=Nonomuraea cypriaca TaxID=1187855 RepID=A0A931ABG4_9ACTN|nr:3-hydroxyacyl-ACP dehydratase FabZ [Nonomuraea cypriaca]MBF8186910.1 3-hydroxyacyl-ACP dehydratase FabZ [Nonomuraea cypriaca]